MHAPIIVFAYNRPWHVEQTLTALSKNVYADESVLYIYCDGPKPNASEEQKAKIAEVRQIVRSQQWCKEVHIVESDENKGLANSIIAAVTNVINDYGKAIIVEDDLITSPYFLKYMNEALDYYEDRKGVFSIGGYNYPHDKVPIPDDYPWDVYVSLRACSWGWATWKDRWNKVDWSMDYMDTLLNTPEMISAFNRGGEDMMNMLKMQQQGKVDSWAIRFCFAHFYQHAVTILPCESQVDNGGLDGSGVHCTSGQYDSLGVDLSKAKSEMRFLDVLYEDRRIINAFYSRTYPGKRPIWQKACNFLARKLHRKPPFVIKKKIYA